MNNFKVKKRKVIKKKNETIKYNIEVGVSVENDNIVNIILSNNTYVPIKPEKYNKTSHKNVLSNIDLFKLDIKISYDKEENDSRKDFTNEYNYGNLQNIVNNLDYSLKK